MSAPRLFPSRIAIFTGFSCFLSIPDVFIDTHLLYKKDFHITFYSEQYSKILPLSQGLCPKEELPHFSFSFFY